MGAFGGGGGNRGEPLVGRGTARPTGDGPPDGLGAGGGELDRDDDPERSYGADRSVRSVPRPPLRPGDGGRWTRAGARVRNPRLLLGVALVIVLAAAWAAVGRAPSSEGLPPGPTTGPTTVPATPRRAPRSVPPAPAAVAVAVPRWVPTQIAATCRARAREGSEVVVDCTPGRGVDHLRYRAFASPADLRAAYDRDGGHRGGTGSPVCAAGGPEERTWSGSAAPSRPLGRYRCSLDRGRARLVWTDARARVIADATRTDADLRSLYEWWTTVPGPNPS